MATSLTLQVRYETPPAQEINLIGFLFDCFGQLIDRQLVRKETLEFQIPETDKQPTKRSIELTDYRVFIAPADDRRIESVDQIAQLESYKAYEPILRRNADGQPSILPIPEANLIFWPRCKCRVSGTVSKWFNAGNQWEDRPVCRARVHICDIDSIRYWIYRIPDTIIAKIPDAFLEPRIPIPIPNPDPGPLFENTNSIRPVPSLFNNPGINDAAEDAAATLPDISPDIRKSLATGTVNQIREILLENYSLFHPWFCYWPWWWRWFYRCDELKTVYTNANGRFDTEVSYWCFGDRPDIYIWIEYLIDGQWTTVYRPPIPCYTHWNYDCTTPINIHITDPRVPGRCCCHCPVPGDAVWIRSVGSTSVHHIYQRFDQVLPPPNQTVPYNRVGLTDAAAIYDTGYLPTSTGDFKRPFGGSPGFYVRFGSDLPNNGIQYYRWSYRKVNDADLTPVADSFKTLLPAGGATFKSYTYEFTDINGDTQFGSNTVKLGPLAVGGSIDLYQIPPTDPNMAPINAPENNAIWDDPDTRTIAFDSSELLESASPGGDGLYEFKLELFDQAGNLMNNLPKSIYKIPQFNNAGFSENASDDYLLNPTANQAQGYRMLMRIDNSVCSSALYKVTINGSDSSTDCCGFVSYRPGGIDGVLGLAFTASHPNEFAVFSFNVHRGTCADDISAFTNASGMVIDNANGYLRDGAGTYRKNFTPAQLLGSCYNNGTGKAAFAENLSVITMATDGTFRVRAKDAPSRTAAFALEP